MLCLFCLYDFAGCDGAGEQAQHRQVFEASDSDMSLSMWLDGFRVSQKHAWPSARRPLWTLSVVSSFP